MSAVVASKWLRDRRRFARNRSRRGTRRAASVVVRRPRPSNRRVPAAVRRSGPRERACRVVERDVGFRCVLGFGFGLAFDEALLLERRSALRFTRRLARRCSAFDSSFFAITPR